MSDCCLLTNEQLFSYVIAGTSSEDDFQRFIMFKPIRSNGDHLGCLVTFNTEHILEKDHQRNISHPGSNQFGMAGS